MTTETSLQVGGWAGGPHVFQQAFRLYFPNAPHPTSPSALVHHCGAWAPVVGENHWINSKQWDSFLLNHPPTQWGKDSPLNRGVAVMYVCKCILKLYFCQLTCSYQFSCPCVSRFGYAAPCYHHIHADACVFLAAFHCCIWTSTTTTLLPLKHSIH